MSNDFRELLSDLVGPFESYTTNTKSAQEEDELANLFVEQRKRNQNPATKEKKVHHIDNISEVSDEQFSFNELQNGAHAAHHHFFSQYCLSGEPESLDKISSVIKLDDRKVAVCGPDQ